MIWWVVFKKEVLDALRDYRAVLSAVMFPLLGPLLIAFTFSHVVETGAKVDDLSLPIVGAEHAPQLVDWLEENGIEAADAPADPEAAVAAADLDLVLVIPASFPEELRAGEPASLQMVVDRSRRSTSSASRRVERLIESYDKRISTLRLLARGVSPKLTKAVDLREVDVATPEKLAANLLDMVVMFLILSAFVGNMYIAIDTTAGERERGSLEPLLTTPAPRWGIVVGKWASAVLFGATGLVITMVLTVILIGRVPTEDLGFRVALTPAMGALALLVVFPLAFFAASLQMLTGAFAKSFKEAQTYMTLTMFLPMLPGLFMSLNPFTPDPWMYAVPLLTQQLLTADLFRGELGSGAELLLGTSTTLVLAAVLLLVTARLYHREGFVFR